jgi:hypothetical protein
VASLDGSTPNPDAIVAIAAAYLILTRRAAPAEAPIVSRWRLADRLSSLDPLRVRFAAHAGSRWSAAGRLDG